MPVQQGGVTSMHDEPLMLLNSLGEVHYRPPALHICFEFRAMIETYAKRPTYLSDQSAWSACIPPSLCMSFSQSHEFEANTQCSRLCQSPNRPSNPSFDLFMTSLLHVEWVCETLPFITCFMLCYIGLHSHDKHAYNIT